MGRALSYIKRPCSSLYLNFVRLPFGVSIITLTYSDFGPNGCRLEMSRPDIMIRRSPVKSSSSKIHCSAIAEVALRTGTEIVDGVRTGSFGVFAEQFLNSARRLMNSIDIKCHTSPLFPSPID